MRDYGYHRYEVGGMEMGHLPRRRPMGMDPNYRGGVYRGQRMREQDDHAAYGRYRREHADELGPYGGFAGRATGAGRLRDPGPMRPSGPAGPPRPPYGTGGRRYGRDYGGGYGADFRRTGYDRGPGPRLERAAAERFRMRSFDAARGPRYDRAFHRYAGYRGTGFSEGYLASGF